MGHKGSIEAVYTTNRNTLSDTLLSEMKNAYVAASKLLNESIDPVRSSDMLKEMELLKYETQVQTLHRIGQVRIRNHRLVEGKGEGKRKDS